MRPDMVFNHGSNGKVMTAWALMRLFEAGKVELDAPANRHLWQIPSTAFDPNGVTPRRREDCSARLAAMSSLGADLSGSESVTLSLTDVDDAVVGQAGTFRSAAATARSCGRHPVMRCDGCPPPVSASRCHRRRQTRRCWPSTSSSTRRSADRATKAGASLHYIEDESADPWGHIPKSVEYLSTLKL
jgi:hypothetical protein